MVIYYDDHAPPHLHVRSGDGDAVAMIGASDGVAPQLAAHHAPCAASLDDGTLVDVDASGRPVGIEIIGPSRGWALGAILERYSLADDDVATLQQVFGSPTVA